MKNFFKLTFCLLLVGCGGNDDAPAPPQPALLEFPLQNSECTAGVAIDGTNTSRLEFRWQPSNHTETYELRATNLNTDVPQTITSETTSASLVLERGVPYSWSVISKNSRATQTSSSETWQFYNAGSQTTYAPFPAEIISPKSGASVGKDQNNELLLEWSGADVDNDIVAYDVFFSDSTPPETLIASPSANTTSIRVSVASDTIYYWRIITRDGEGNTSDTGIFEFKVL